MQIDRQEGRPLELEAIYAEPLRRAAAGGIDMPCWLSANRKPKTDGSEIV